MCWILFTHCTDVSTQFWTIQPLLRRCLYNYLNKWNAFTYTSISANTSIRIHEYEWTLNQYTCTLQQLKSHRCMWIACYSIMFENVYNTDVMTISVFFSNSSDDEIICWLIVECLCSLFVAPHDSFPHLILQQQFHFFPHRIRLEATNHDANSKLRSWNTPTVKAGVRTSMWVLAVCLCVCVSARLFLCAMCSLVSFASVYVCVCVCQNLNDDIEIEL